MFRSHEKMPEGGVVGKIYDWQSDVKGDIPSIPHLLANLEITIVHSPERASVGHRSVLVHL